MGDLPHVPGTSTSQIESSHAFWLSYDFLTGAGTTGRLQRTGETIPARRASVGSLVGTHSPHEWRQRGLCEQ